MKTIIQKNNFYLYICLGSDFKTFELLSTLLKEIASTIDGIITVVEQAVSHRKAI